MEKTNDIDQLGAVRSNANSLNFQSDIVSQTPPTLQLKVDKHSSLDEVSEEQSANAPFQFAADGGGFPSGSPEDSDPHGNTEAFTTNNTGLPNQLKSGVEQLSGYSLDDVKVHYNSDKPAQLNAHAYAQGTDIHLSSGQEKHLPHEAWHVVQQKQGRVRPTTQFKAFNINDDSTLEKEADVMGAEAMQLHPQQNQRPTLKKENTRGAVQLKKESVAITGTTHLVALDEHGTSLYEGKNDQFLRNGELVEIDKSKKLRSRRGPNQEDDDLRAHDKTGGHLYRYYHATKVNGKDVSGDRLYLRDETFLHSDANSDYDDKHDSLTEKQSEFSQLKVKVLELLSKIDRVFDLLIPDGTLETEDLEIELQKGKPAISNLVNLINNRNPKTEESILVEQKAIIDMLGSISDHLEKNAYTAKSIQEPSLGVGLINLAEESHTLMGVQKKKYTKARGSEYSTGKDTAGDILGAEDVYQTTVGLTGAIVGTPGVLQTGSAAAAVTTGVSYFLGPVGILFGTIGVVLGIKAVIRGYNSEKKLKRLVPHLENERIAYIARYAQEKKRKKKWGGAITITASVAAIAGGILGIVALSVATLGVAAAILGIGAALIGLGVFAGKVIHHFRKRAMWKKKMSSGLKDISKGEKEGIIPSDLTDLVNAAVMEDDDPQNRSSDANKALEEAIVEKAESRRELLSQNTVHYYFDGTPKEKYEALLVMEALNIKEQKIKKVERSNGRKGVVSLVAKKMKSW